MGRYLNSRVPFEVYREIAGTRFFVDKSLILEEILSAVEVDGQKYLCITRPRRFGKSIMACMVAAFLGKAVDAEKLFGRLFIMFFTLISAKCQGIVQVTDSILPVYRMG